VLLQSPESPCANVLSYIVPFTGSRRTLPANSRFFFLKWPSDGELPVSPFSSPAHARGSVACPPHGDSHSRTTTVVVSPRCRRRQSGRNGCQPTKSALWLANLPTPEAAHGQSNMPRRMLLPGHGHEFQQIDLGAANSSVPAASRSLDPTRSPLFPLQPAMARCHWRKW